MARSIHTADSEQLLEAMPDAVVMVEMDGRVVRVNGRAESLSGYSREELVGLAIEDLVPEALRSAHVAHRTAYQRKPTVRSMGTHLDIRFRRKDGSEFPADIALSPVVTEQGVLIVAAVRDITERRRAEEELLQAQEGFRLVVEGVRDYAILMLDPEGRVSTWSPGAARLEGYEAGEIIGRHFSTFYPEADVAAGKPARDLAAAADVGRYEEEGWRVRKDGSRFWANVVISAIRDHAGKLLGFAKITRDVTERKRQDDRLRAVLEIAQATLEGRGEEDLLDLVARRARALAESALGAVLLFNPDEELMSVAAADGPRAGLVAGATVPRAGPAIEDAVAPGAPSLKVRLASGERAIGSLLLSNEPGGRQFTDGDRELLELFA